MKVYNLLGKIFCRRNLLHICTSEKYLNTHVCQNSFPSYDSLENAPQPKVEIWYYDYYDDKFPTLRSITHQPKQTQLCPTCLSVKFPAGYTK